MLEKWKNSLESCCVMKLKFAKGVPLLMATGTGRELRTSQKACAFVTVERVAPHITPCTGLWFSNGSAKIVCVPLASRWRKSA